MKYKKWIVFGLTAIVVIVSQFFVQQRYTGLLQVGAEYQWPVTLSRSAGWIPSDYLTVTFLGTRTAWTGARPPVVNLNRASAWALPMGWLATASRLAPAMAPRE